MSIYQKLNNIENSLESLTGRTSNLEIGVLTVVTASNLSASSGFANLTRLTGSSISGSLILANSLTASNFSASSGFANLNYLTASNFSASAGFANLTRLTASNLSASSGFANLTRLTASNLKTDNLNVTNTVITYDIEANNSINTNALTVTDSLVVGSFSYDSMTDSLTLDNNSSFYMLNGSGIEFESTLDSYEEGTWTPIYSGSTTQGVSIDGVKQGYYTKIGRVVFVSCFLSVGSWTTRPTGSIHVAGLPFTAKNAFFHYGFGVAGEFNGFATNFIDLKPKIESNSNKLLLLKTTTSAPTQATELTGSDLASTNNAIIISAAYIT